MRILNRFTIVMSLILPLGVTAAVDGAMGQIMKGLGENMARIGDGIWREDFTVVATGALGIAEHPLPPLWDRLELLAGLGTDATQFMKADEELKAAAMALKEAAGQQRIEEVMSSYQVLQQRCVACHTWYRDVIQKQKQLVLED